MKWKAANAYVAMIAVQVAYGGSTVLIKIALEKGLNQLVFVVYRHLIAMMLLGPFAYVLERKQRPSLSVSVITKIFVLASLGTTIHLNVYYAGLSYASPTVASALSNVSPSFTFLTAAVLGMEKVKFRSAKGGAKVLGPGICIAGSLICTFWKGGFLFKSFEQKPLINLDMYTSNTTKIPGTRQNWIKGPALIITSHVAWSAWLILQAVIYKVYLARLSLNTLICFFASIQSAFLALLFGATSPTLLKGVVNSALVYYLQTWCISKKGPVFAAFFSPVILIAVGLFSAIAFSERLHLGSFIGAVLIIEVLYCVLWGKSRDSCATAGHLPGEGKASANKNLEIPTSNYPSTYSVTTAAGK